MTLPPIPGARIEAPMLTVLRRWVKWQNTHHRVTFVVMGHWLGVSASTLARFAKGETRTHSVQLLDAIEAAYEQCGDNPIISPPDLTITEKARLDAENTARNIANLEKYMTARRKRLNTTIKETQTV